MTDLVDRPETCRHYGSPGMKSASSTSTAQCAETKLLFAWVTPLIDHLTGDEKLGLAFIDGWRTEFQVQNPNGLSAEWIKANPACVTISIP